MTKTLTVEGDITAADTATTLSTQGSVASPALQVPASMSRITKIVAAAAPDVAAAGSATFFIRLGGSAVQKGEQVICIGAGGGQAPQAGSDRAPATVSSFEMDELDIEVTASENIRVQAEMAGTDLGTTRVAVTLVFA